MNIFEIMKEHQSIVDEIEGLEGELTPEIEQKFAKIISEGEDKVRSLYFVYRNKEAQIPGVKAEIERISNIKKRLETEASRIKKILDVYMKITGKTSIKDGVVDMIQAKKTIFEYKDFPKQFIKEETITKELLSEFKTWAKENPDEAKKIGAIFKETTEIRIK